MSMASKGQLAGIRRVLQRKKYPNQKYTQLLNGNPESNHVRDKTFCTLAPGLKAPPPSLPVKNNVSVDFGVSSKVA